MITDIILPIYNTIERPNQQAIMWECINAILCESDSFHLILVDGGSTDDTRKTLTEFAVQHANCTLVLQRDHIGISHTRNAGYYASNNEDIIWMDPDVIPRTKYWNRLLVEAHQEGIAITAPLTTFTGVEEQKSDGTDLPRENVVVSNLPSLCWCTSHTIIEGLREVEQNLGREPVPGLFDTDYIRWGYEDSDMAYRFSLINKKLLIVGNVFTYHHGGVFSASIPGQEMYDNLIANMKRYSEKFQ